MLDWISLHPYWAGAAIFWVALAESLAGVGLLVPGTLIMFGVGTLVATGTLDLWTALAWAAAGAVAGDATSYWLGHHFQEQLHDLWPFRRHPGWLKSGTAFMHRHGGKGILLGRFVGPMRPIIPAVAGMLGMAPLRSWLTSSPRWLGRRRTSCQGWCSAHRCNSQARWLAASW